MHKDSVCSQVLFSNEDKAKGKDSSDKDSRHRNPYPLPYPCHWNPYPSPYPRLKTKLASVLNLCLQESVKVSI